MNDDQFARVLDSHVDRSSVRYLLSGIQLSVTEDLQLGNIKRGSRVYAYLDTLNKESEDDVPFGFFAEPDEVAMQAHRNAQKQKMKSLIQQSIAAKEKSKEKDTPEDN